ncbi:MAG: hypothetical protein WCF36_01065 [Candidatus Nanopelagicales bacterium]
MARRLVLMGSGETTPGMLGVHREVFAGLPEDAQLALMDSPFAFQENADELVERISGYFAESLGRAVERITLPAGADALTQEQALAGIRAADWVFAGPGSPSYARRAWAGTPIPAALAQVVAPGRAGALVVASAAAVTLGAWALPVYEIYKVGADPRWEPGIGLMDRVLGWRCAVIPHYDNKEGGTHDTRFCYLGGRRLARIEGELDGGFIVGVDEHTAVVFDLDAARVRVAGRGGLTLRVAGVEHVVPAGSDLPMAEIEAIIDRLGASAASDRSGPGSAAGSDGSGSRASAGSPGPGPVGADPGHGAPPPARDDDSPAALALSILEAIADSAGHARAAVVGLLRHAEQAADTHDRELAGRAVQAVVDLRAQARAAGDWAASDRLRDVLAGLGVEVRDARDGSTWSWS